MKNHEECVKLIYSYFSTVLFHVWLLTVCGLPFKRNLVKLCIYNLTVICLSFTCLVVFRSLHFLTPLLICPVAIQTPSRNKMKSIFTSTSSVQLILKQMASSVLFSCYVINSSYFSISIHISQCMGLVMRKLWMTHFLLLVPDPLDSFYVSRHKKYEQGIAQTLTCPLLKQAKGTF